MPELRLRTVDAFTDRPFQGNPAAVVVCGNPPPDSWMQSVAAELNLAETAFVLPAGRPGEAAVEQYGLRWFTPTVEVDMCGHATLAAAHCLFADGADGPLRFATRSGELVVRRGEGAQLVMDFPAGTVDAVDAPDGLAAMLGAEVSWVGRTSTGDLLAVLADEQAVQTLRPDLAQLAQIEVRGVAVTAAASPATAAEGVDFVSRFFGPRVGVAEDPVTGSAHTVLGPYWGALLGRSELVGAQLSARGGRVGVRLLGARVELVGNAVTVLDAVLSPAAAGDVR